MLARQPLGFLLSLAASLLLTVALGVAPTFAAEIRFAANPLAEVQYFQRAAEAAGDSSAGSQSSEEYEKFVRNMLDEGFLDMRADCGSYWTMLDTDSAYFINGEIRGGDAARLAALMDQEKASREEYDCFEPIIIDSRGGDLTEAIKIGRLVAAESRAVVVEPGKECLSACVMILMAGRYRDESFFVPLSFAFEDSVIGVHSPFLDIFSGPQNEDQTRLLQASPDRYFEMVGDAWRAVTDYMVEVTHSDYYVSAILNPGGATTDHFYMISSPVEAALAGLHILPYRQRQMPARISREFAFQACLLQFADEKSRRLDEVSLYSQFIGDVLIAYYPYQEKICLVESGKKGTRIISGTYGPNRIGLGEDFFLASKPFDPTTCVGTIKSLQAERDRILALLVKHRIVDRNDLPKEFGIPADDSGNEKADISDVFDLYAVSQGADRYTTVAGAYRGRYMFARQEELPLNTTSSLGDGDAAIPEMDARFAKGETIGGGEPDIVIGNYVFAKLVFSLWDQNCIGEFGLGIDPQLQVLMGEKPVIVGDSCGNSYGVCSPVTGVVEGSKLRLVTSH